MTTKQATGKGKLSHGQFFIKAIHTLRTPGYEGIHAVFSGFNTAFREYFPGDDVQEVGSQLAKQGIIRVVPCRKGVMIFDGSVPYDRATKSDKTNATLAKILS